jgi:hypothetical protein
MDSEGVDSNPCYNTPTSAADGEFVSSEKLEHSSLDITYTRGLGVAEAIANAFAD